jgi:transposase
MAFFNDQAVRVLDWPPYSPDLNPIENLWAILKKRIYRSAFAKPDELQDADN